MLPNQEQQNPLLQKESTFLPHPLVSYTYNQNHFDRFSHCPSIDELIDKIDWETVKCHFVDDFRFFEPLLFQLHFKRQHHYANFELNHILTFLNLGYQFSNDIRYLNEFLWFCPINSEFKELLNNSINEFYKNTEKTGKHPFPLASDKEVNDFLSISKEKIQSIKELESTKKPFKIAFLGIPTQFKKSYHFFMSKKINVELLLIPNHKSKLVQLFFKLKIPFFFLALINGVVNYKELSYSKSDKNLIPYLKNKQFNVGFHRLNMIIKKDLIDCFTKGIINDHWGLLPYIRGRNTIDYSVLMGIPLCATTHFIEETIDTGKIISIHDYQYLVNQCKSIAELRELIKNKVTERINLSVQLVMNTESDIINNTNLGLTYYVIHPYLSEYIDTKILNK